jgi:hypothetical protein
MAIGLYAGRSKPRPYKSEDFVTKYRGTVVAKYRGFATFVLSIAILAFAPAARAQSAATTSAQNSGTSAAAQPGLAPIRKYIAEG